MERNDLIDSGMKEWRYEWLANKKDGLIERGVA